MFDFIASLFSAIANFFDFSKQKQALKNTPEMQSNQQAKLIEKDKQQAINDINAESLDQLRKDVSE